MGARPHGAQNTLPDALPQGRYFVGGVVQLLGELLQRTLPKRVRHQPVPTKPENRANVLVYKQKLRIMSGPHFGFKYHKLSQPPCPKISTDVQPNRSKEIISSRIDSMKNNSTFGILLKSSDSTSHDIYFLCYFLFAFLEKFLPLFGIFLEQPFHEALEVRRRFAHDSRTLHAQRRNILVHNLITQIRKSLREERWVT